MFVRMLTVHCDQNDSYEITINGFQVIKINAIRNVSKKIPFLITETSYQITQFI